ncbi:MAG: HutD family protein [Betaproteobacteria bacterium]
MTVQQIDVNAVTPQAWRNGGGQTRELWVWPSAGPWQLRISRADIERDGAFSAYADVRRWFAVLQGGGVELQFGASRHCLRRGDAPLYFDGAQAPGCRLLDGPTQDLNLMTSSGDATMVLADADLPWSSGHAMRGLYTTVAGRWSDGSQQCQLAAHSLLWDDAAATDRWNFSAETGGGVACWLGFTPAG